MRVFKVSDGSSWIARLHDGLDDETAHGARVGWEAILFVTESAATPQRIVYRPAGWLARATPAELVAALDEGEVVRARWGE